MKIFSYEKYKRAEKYDSTWARESDGHIVRGQGNPWNGLYLLRP